MADAVSLLCKRMCRSGISNAFSILRQRHPTTPRPCDSLCVELKTDDHCDTAAARSSRSSRNKVVPTGATAESAIAVLSASAYAGCKVAHEQVSRRNTARANVVSHLPPFRTGGQHRQGSAAHALTLRSGQHQASTSAGSHQSVQRATLAHAPLPAARRPRGAPRRCPPSA